MQVLFDALLGMPVIMAHTTETKRRTVKGALRNVFWTYETLTDIRLRGCFRQKALGRLQCDIQLLRKTDEVRARQVSAAEKIHASLIHFPLSLFRATTPVYRNLKRAVSDVYGKEAARLIHVPSFLRFVPGSAVTATGTPT